MKYWVVKRGENNDYEFHPVESKTMTDAVREVDGGIVVVSNYFKKNYKKYCKYYDKLKRNLKVIREEFDDSYWDSAYSVMNTILGEENLMEKNYLYIDDYSYKYTISLYNLSDYQFEQLLNVLEEKTKYLR